MATGAKRRKADDGRLGGVGDGAVFTNNLRRVTLTRSLWFGQPLLLLLYFFITGLGSLLFPARGDEGAHTPLRGSASGSGAGLGWVAATRERALP
jgi:hypothetical protein